MIIAAIDIGSNAIRLQIVRSIETKKIISFKKLQYLRFPLRLGEEVFNDAVISSASIERLSTLMATFKNLIDLYNADGYRAVATSAMREATNGKAVCEHIKNKTGINIEIIAGNKEAKTLQKAIIPFLNQENYIHIDVGGGSTEINIFKGKRLVGSKSFNVGSVRKLSKKARTATFNDIKEWIIKSKFNNVKNIVSIGTGGNIYKIYKIANKGSEITISLAELKALRAYIDAFSFEDRLSFLKMNPDRADVIVPASEIYIKIMQFVESDHIMVPQVGLKDGIIYELYEKISGKDLALIEFL